MEHLVTRTNLDSYPYTFAVLTNATNGGVAFHVTITSKKSDIYPDSRVNVDRVIRRRGADGSLEGSSVGPVTPAIPVTLEKENRVWKADFTLPRELLADAGVCLVFSELTHSTVNGKVVAMPSTTFYELRLQDFTKP